MGALIYPGGGFRSGSPFAIRFGRWKQVSKGFFFSEYMPSDELDDLKQVVADVVAYFDEPSVTRKARR